MAKQPNNVALAPSLAAPAQQSTWDSLTTGVGHTLQFVGKGAETGHRTMDLLNCKVIKVQIITRLEDAGEVHNLIQTFPGGPDAAQAIVDGVMGMSR